MAGDILTVLSFLAALGAGLVAGVFFAFSSFVMNALGRLPAADGLAAMRAINVTVITPSFLGLFLGMAALAAALAVGAGLDSGDPRALWLMVGAALYLLGCFGVTMRCNVPLNEALAEAGDGAEAEEMWRRYLRVWTGWNTVRTVASLLASAAYIQAAMI